MLLAGGAHTVVAAEKETRDFTIYVDNKKAGTYVMNIDKQENGVFVMAGKAQLRVSYLVYTYTYVYEGTETWKDGMLHSFKSRTNDNGKRFEVAAMTEKNGLSVTVNGRQRVTRADVWLTSYWRLPATRNGALPLLDADTGKDINGQLRYLGLEMVTVEGKQLKCKHFRLTGGPSPVDVWFDEQDYLVRQSTVEQGHKTLIHLAKVRR
jgi:hypothetical protein